MKGSELNKDGRSNRERQREKLNCLRFRPSDLIATLRWRKRGLRGLWMARNFSPCQTAFASLNSLSSPLPKLRVVLFRVHYDALARKGTRDGGR